MLDILKKLLQDAEKTTYNRVITGNSAHPAKISGKVEVPEYIKNYTGAAIFTEAAYLLSGKAVIVIEGVPYAMQPGYFCFIQHGMKHFESYFQKNEAYEMVWFGHSSVFRVRIHHTAYIPEKGLKINTVILMKIKPEVHLSLEDIFKVTDPKKNFKEVKEKIKIWARGVNDNLEKKRYDLKLNTDRMRKVMAIKEKRLRPAVDYLMNHYAEKITLKDIASQVSLSPAYFAVMFDEIYNHPLHEFITELRMKEAYRLLDNTDLTVNEIAYKTGYKDPLFFRHIFKKYTGIPPKEFRLRNVNAPMVITPAGSGRSSKNR